MFEDILADDYVPLRERSALYQMRELKALDYKLMAMPEKFRRTQPGRVNEQIRDRVKRLIWLTPEMYVRGANMLIFGSPGVGKSSVASLFARSFRAHRIPSFWKTTWQIREHNRERERFGEEQDLSMMQRVRAVEVLVIDDLRDDPMDVWFSLTDLVNLVKVRHESLRPTIITSSLPEVRLFQHPVIGVLYERLIVMKIEGESLYEQRFQDFGKGFG